MALVKPIVNEIVAFDARVGTTVTFTASGGDQITKNEIKVVTNDANETMVYHKTVTSYVLSNTIPANVLTNGQYYKVAIRTYDTLNNTSAWSNYQPFYCYSTPVLALNISDGQTITTSTYRVQLTYTQLQNEKVDYALIEIYQNERLIDSSGNLYNSDFPPLRFDYDVVGLNDESQYYVVGTVVTVNGTIVQTNKTRFYTDFSPIINPSTLTATLDSCNGYVNLHSSIVGKIGGISNPTPLTYIKHNTMADIRSAVADIDIENSYWAKWNKLFSIPKDFLLRLWFYPARQPFKIIELANSDSSAYLSIYFKRGITTDYLSIRTDNGVTIDKALNTHCNGNTKVFLWLKVVGDVWDVRFSILSSTNTIMEWNNNNDNIPYNVTSDVVYGNTNYEDFTPSADNYDVISDDFTSVIVGNGVFDHLDITKDISITYTEDIPVYDEENTVLDITFNGNINNTSTNYTKLVLKRKDDTLLNWLNISEVEVDYNVETYIDFNDSFIPTGIKQEYALVVYVDDTPSEYHTVDIVPVWGKYFLSDKDRKFVLNEAVIYSSHVQNIQNGVLMPIGATYPIVIQNGEGNYRSGSLQFKVLGYEFNNNKRLDRISMTRELNDILAFLTNGKAKCLTDFNGNIFILKVINSPQISYDGNWGNNIPTVSFDWVEQGKYNNYEDMLNLGLFDYVATE